MLHRSCCASYGSSAPPADAYLRPYPGAIEGIGIKAKEYKEPLFSIKRGYRRRTTPPLFMILFDGAKCSSHASTIRVVVDT